MFLFLGYKRILSGGRRRPVGGRDAGGFQALDGGAAHGEDRLLGVAGDVGRGQEVGEWSDPLKVVQVC